MQQRKVTIGRTTDISLLAENSLVVPAKVDTGADSSSIWASSLAMDAKKGLSFVLFSHDSPLYTGQRHHTKNYKVSAVRSAHGNLQVRYKVQLTVVIEGRRVKGTFTLADRSKNTYPILIGCRLLNNKFIVDVSKGRKQKNKSLLTFNQELKEDPVAFFNKYHHQNERGDIES
ncbi:MAG TPA: RimK/LysX family protein [Candidatus Saccharibacteria bacterium]|nr:RimK/LysX family protein [Candidatus Saccharibacteria bacterium]